MQETVSFLPFTVPETTCLDTRGTSKRNEPNTSNPAPLSSRGVALIKVERIQYLNGKLADRLRGVGCAREADRLQECQVKQGLWFCLDCGKTFYHPITCRLRFCIHCSKLVSRKVAKEVYKMTSLMSEPKLLTLTMARTPDLKGGIEKIRKCFAKWRKLNAIKRNLKGGLYHLEVLPKENGWHIHIHAVVDMSFLPKQIIYGTWAKVLNQSSASVDIQRINSLKAAYEVCKYITKVSRMVSWSDKQLREFVFATKNARVYQTFGESFGVKKKIKNATTEAFEIQCPHCQAVRGVYPARAGPGQFGRDWPALARSILGLNPEKRVAPGLSVQIGFMF